MSTIAKMPALLLAWYDRHHREMPWRVAPAAQAGGQRADPYHVWLSEVMLQQTTVAAASGYFRAFLRAWPDVHALAAAPVEDVLAAWAGLGYYARARNLHKCARIVSQERGGAFPETEAGLRDLPGIGAYTAAAVAAIAFDRPATVVDGNVERVMARVFAVTEPLPGAKPRLTELAASLTPQARPGDYAQAVMDLGATVCTPRRPACMVCPWRPDCRAHAEGLAERLPARAPKSAKPVRHGTVFVAEDRAGNVLVIRRPPKGLLGGMLALPSTDWRETPLPANAPFAADWRETGAVRHTFTHFHLRLRVLRAIASPLPGEAMDRDEAESAMPTVFAKALRLAGG